MAAVSHGGRLLDCSFLPSPAGKFKQKLWEISSDTLTGNLGGIIFIIGNLTTYLT
jgi:hypothetical protein